MKIYDNPLYYEIAFDFVDIPEQLDTYEEFIEEYSEIEVERVLDLGCGPSLQLRDFARRGYDAVGLDMNPEMLSYLEKKAAQEGLNIDTICDDFIDFRLDDKVDFVMILMGTHSYIKSNEEFQTHLDSVAGSLRSGGLYLIEDMRLNWASEDFISSDSWMMSRDDIDIKIKYNVELIDEFEQTLLQTLKMEVTDGDEFKLLTDEAVTKVFFPQEFLTLVEMNGKFEFIGWFERFKNKKLEKASPDNVVLLRRK